MMFLQTNNQIKIRVPSVLTKNYWTIEEKSKKTTYAVSKLAVLITVACSRQITKANLLNYLLEKQQINEDRAEETLNSLIFKNIICSSEIEHHDSEIWKKTGWEAAANYHFFTWDAQFLDYSKEGGGHDLDRKKMVRYQEAQPDNFRCKSYKTFLEQQPLPIITEFPSEVKDLEMPDKIKLLLSLAFGKRGEKACHWSNVPLFRRTSPSGGSRHPTEGYFLSQIESLRKGWHHVQTEPPSLIYLAPFSKDLAFFERENPGYLGAIVLTSIFERNMYRYREPRTFRTIHMDSGHVLATIELISNELGIETQVLMNFDENEILKKINASKFEEGVMAVILLREKI